MSCLSDDISELIYRINTVMDRQQIGVGEFARMVGVTHATVNNWLSGRSKPTRPAIKRLEAIVKEAELQKRVPKITVRQAADCIGASEKFVRVGLQEGRIPFGVAVKEESHWAYNISPHLLRQYVGEEYFDDYFKN